MEQTLDRCCPGTRSTIVRVEGDPGLQQRLLELGFVPGTEVAVVRLATLGDPMQVQVRGYHLSLRKREARTVVVTAGNSSDHPAASTQPDTVS